MPISNNKKDLRLRPTKKQLELLAFIADFISEHGYSPSYREIMNGLNYTSVATVALHVNSLIARGHLIKREHSARSLEVVNNHPKNEAVLSNEITPLQEKWLVEKVEHAFREVENSTDRSPQSIDSLVILVDALKVLGLEGASASFMPRLKQLKLT